MRGLVRCAIVLSLCLAVGVGTSCEPENTQDIPQEIPTPQPDPKPQPEPEPEPEVDPVLPSVHLFTPNNANVYAWNSEWLEGASGFVVGERQDTSRLGTLSLKARGNSTRWYPKMSYNIKLDEKSEILGIDDNKSWCLLAQWMDRTCLRNDVAFEIARRTKGLKWTPNGKFVDLYLNGEHQGLYYLVEKIKVGKHRVNVSEAKGYILELDTNYDEQYKFHSTYYKMPVMVSAPDADDMTDDMFSRIKLEVNELESALTRISSGNEGYQDLLDLDSFIDWFFVQELTMNQEAQHPKSSYMHHNATGKMFAGPVWDFDWYTFVPENSYAWINSKHIWYGALFQSNAFKARLKQKWAEEKALFSTIPDYIDSRAAYIKDAAEVNGKMWPINQTVNGDESMTWQAAVTRMRVSYQSRFNKVDKLVEAL